MLAVLTRFLFFFFKNGCFVPIADFLFNSLGRAHTTICCMHTLRHWINIFLHSTHHNCNFCFKLVDRKIPAAISSLGNLTWEGIPASSPVFMSSSTCSSTATGLQTDRKPWKQDESDQQCSIKLCLVAHSPDVVLYLSHQGLDSKNVAKHWQVQFSALLCFSCS